MLLFAALLPPLLALTPSIAGTAVPADPAVPSRCWHCHVPSVRRALPPVGTHSTVLQLGQTTTVWLWLNTVVLQTGEAEEHTRDTFGTADKSSASLLCDGDHMRDRGKGRC